MRLFVALEISSVVHENLAAQIKELRDLSERLGDERPRWVRPENLHVTLKFIGEAASAKLDDIRGALANVRLEGPIDLQLQGLGFFPDERRPRVLWAGLKASPNLATLAGDIDRALETQGVAREKREFTPHLTLARFEPPGLHENVCLAIQKNGERKFGSFQAREFHLIESKTKPSGAEYTRVASFSFTLEA